MHKLDGLPPSLFENVCETCGKICKSSPGLKRYMKVHEDDEFDLINLIKVDLSMSRRLEAL